MGIFTGIASLAKKGFAKGSSIKNKAFDPGQNIFTKSNVFGATVSGYFAKDAYDTAVESGEGQAKGLRDAAFQLGTDLFLGPVLGTAVYAASGLPSALASASSELAQQGRFLSQQSYRPFQFSRPVNSGQYATMRQAGMALAKQSQYSMQQVLMGSEAKNFHR